MSQTIIIGGQDSNIAYLLQRYAEESGFQACSIRLNDDLLDLVWHQKPALIILEIDCSEPASREMVRRVKAEPAMRNVPVVVYSCLNEPPEDWREGVDGFLLKSALYDDFTAVLERAGVLQVSDGLPLNQEQANRHDPAATDDPAQHRTRPAVEH